MIEFSLGTIFLSVAMFVVFCLGVDFVYKKDEAWVLCLIVNIFIMVAIIDVSGII